MIYSKGIPPNHESMVMEILSPIIAVGCILAAFILPKRVLKQKKDGELETRFKQYQTATILRYALMELATFIAIIAYLLSAQWYGIIVPVVLIAIQFYLFPTSNRVRDDLETTKEALQAL